MDDQMDINERADRLVDYFMSDPWFAAQLWDQMIDAEAQFGDDYFWMKHGHQRVMEIGRAKLREVGIYD